MLQLKKTDDKWCVILELPWLSFAQFLYCNVKSQDEFLKNKFLIWHNLTCSKRNTFLVNWVFLSAFQFWCFSLIYILQGPMLKRRPGPREMIQIGGGALATHSLSTLEKEVYNIHIWTNYNYKKTLQIHIITHTYTNQRGHFSHPPFSTQEIPAMALHIGNVMDIFPWSRLSET